MTASRPRILLLAYHFPPVGGAGAQRAVKLVSYLASRGYEPIVITGPGGAAGRFNPSDALLGGEIPASVRVLRVAGPEPPPSDGWRSRAERLAQWRCEHARWWIRGAVREGRGLAGEVDLIHAFLDPYDTALAAGKLASRLGVPWVADLQDPWALDEMRLHPSGLHLRLDRARMSRQLDSAAAVVMNTPDAAAALTATLPRPPSTSVHAIPNGFDADEWAGEPPARRDDAFRIVHTGTMHTELGLRHRRSGRLRRLIGGTVAPIDILSRSVFHLLEALDELAARRPDLAAKVELHLAGVLSDADRAVIERSAAVRVHGFLPHAETVALIRSADLLFLPMHDLPEGTRARLVPCKTYEYLASGRPILAAVPDGDARDLLERASATRVCRPSDAAAMANALEAELEGRWPRPSVAQARQALLERYERTALATELAGVFAAVLERSPATSVDKRTFPRPLVHAHSEEP